MLSLENITLFECDSHPCSVLSALTAHETTSVQPPADLQPEKKSLNFDGCRRLCQGVSDCGSVYMSLFFADYPGTFTVLSSSYNLRGNHILALPNTKTTTYSLHSFSYEASKIWNSFPNSYKKSHFLQFKQEILKYEPFLKNRSRYI